MSLGFCTRILPLFQFHKGTIRTPHLSSESPSLYHFNSIKVQLELPSWSLPRPLLAHFNSIKVQLERMISVIETQGWLFQFHKGTIRTSAETISMLPVRYFNSIKVQLEHNYAVKALRTVLYFNSIKVQLERAADKT